MSVPSSRKLLRLPDFLIAGAPRTGTTSLYRYLGEHPEIYLPSKKELHYFTHEYLTENSNGPKDTDFAFCKTLDEYKMFFQSVPSSVKAVGDVSPSYLFFPQCIPRIKNLLGENVKIIIMLRNPIERAFSNYRHMVHLKRETLSFFDALQAEEDRVEKRWRNIWLYKRHSLYYGNVRKYLVEFGSAKVKVILYDDFSKDTLKTMHDVHRFLGVTAEFIPKNIKSIYARGVAYKRGSIGSWAQRVLPPRALRILRTFKGSRSRGKTNSEVLQDERSSALLAQYFQEDIRRLEGLLQIDLTMWK